jgi:hypothetical protein
MSRALTTGMLAAIATGQVKPIFMVEAEFSGGTVRLFTGYGSVSWNGKTWTGDAGLLRISNVQEVSELQAVNFTISLNGQVSALASIALDQVRRGLAGTVWLGLLNDSGALIADPYQCFKGRADKPDIIPDPNDAVIAVAYESRMIVATKAKSRRYTSEDQKIDFPADLGFDYVPSLQDATFTWGNGAMPAGAAPSPKKTWVL